MAKVKLTPKLYRTQKQNKLTDVQVRIYNTSLNFHKALEMPHAALEDYLDRLINEGRDSHGRSNGGQFAHLPLVAFVDAQTGEEVVFNKKEDLPEKLSDIVSSDGTLVASFN